MNAPGLSTEIFRSHSEYAAARSGGGLLRERRAHERGLVTDDESFSVSGYCHVCDRPVDFLVDFQFAYEVDGILTPNWRERLNCPKCDLNSRMRATLHLFETLLKPPPKSCIYITEQLSPIYHRLTARWPETIGSEYLADRIAFGESNSQGIRNESMTGLTFDAEMFDFILSFDVLEHVPDFESALAECLRVLKPGGGLFFTVPFRADLEKNLVRAAIGDDGEIEYREPPEFHGDPLNSEGCLAFYHFGWELLEQLRSIGFADALAHVYWSKELGYLGGEQIAFVARKANVSPHDDRAKEEKMRPWEHQDRNAQQLALAGSTPRDEYVENRVQFVTELVRLFGLDPAKKGFEIGSGEGIMARELSSHCGSLDCTDISQTFLEWARATCKSCKNVQFHQIDKHYLDFLPEESYDFGFSVNVFIHFDLYQIYFYLQSVRRRLKPGGKFFFTGATLGADTWDLFKLFADEYQETRHVHHGFMQWNDLRIIRSIIDEVGLRFSEESFESAGGHLRILVERP